MIGRSLVSLLVVAAVAVQSCVAYIVEDGVYTISSTNGRNLATFDIYELAHAAAAVPSEGIQQKWRVENRGGDRVVIQSTRTKYFLYLPGLDYETWVGVYTSETVWQLFNEGDGVSIRSIYPSAGDNLPLVAAPTRPNPFTTLETYKLDGALDKDYKWTFTQA
ncbi:hypothetical protein B0O80DRAFT_247385 [Mortierella sp. GBAus27b]|nr:hypothetical protein B0O80DRAFT_247385 [Mortierella sp. GBAus27b]